MYRLSPVYYVCYVSLTGDPSTLRLLGLKNLEAYMMANIRATGKVKVLSGSFIDEMSSMVGFSLDGKSIMVINAPTPITDMAK